MQHYPMYPIKGTAARASVCCLGCSLGPEMMTIPDHLKVVPVSSRGITYVVLCASETVFHMQYDQNRWRVIVPVPYRVTFPELVRSYTLQNLWKAGVFGGYGTMLQLMQGIPVQRPVAVATLERLSRATGHPYDLENVTVVLAEETHHEEEERETPVAR